MTVLVQRKRRVDLVKPYMSRMVKVFATPLLRKDYDVTVTSCVDDAPAKQRLKRQHGVVSLHGDDETGTGSDVRLL